MTDQEIEEECAGQTMGEIVKALHERVKALEAEAPKPATPATPPAQ